jgi:peptide methionine sulfoxide reductase MsrB
MQAILFLLCFIYVASGFSPSKTLKNYKTVKKWISMDDEVNRVGIKDDLTTKDDYLNSKFTRLSPSGHDLTPLDVNAVEELLRSLEATLNDIPVKSIDDSLSGRYRYQGENQKGIYVCKIGGLPLFSSGRRYDTFCNDKYLYFTDVCDPAHVHIDDLTSEVKCVRSGILVGKVIEGENKSMYQINANLLNFYSIKEKWPVESQPENFWGTEGQYRAWNQHEITNNPLSY